MIEKKIGHSESSVCLESVKQARVKIMNLASYLAHGNRRGMSREAHVP